VSICGPWAVFSSLCALHFPLFEFEGKESQGPTVPSLPLAPVSHTAHPTSPHLSLVGRPPFYSDDEEEIAEQASKGQYSYPANLKLSDSAKSLIAALLITDPTRRVTANQAMSHPWLTGSVSANPNEGQSTPQTPDKAQDQRLLVRNLVQAPRQEKKADHGGGGILAA